MNIEEARLYSETKEICECGNCSELFTLSEIIELEDSPTGWICELCKEDYDEGRQLW